MNDPFSTDAMDILVAVAIVLTIGLVLKDALQAFGWS